VQRSHPAHMKGVLEQSKQRRVRVSQPLLSGISILPVSGEGLNRLQERVWIDVRVKIHHPRIGRRALVRVGLLPHTPRRIHLRIDVQVRVLRLLEVPQHRPDLHSHGPVVLVLFALLRALGVDTKPPSAIHMSRL